MKPRLIGITGGIGSGKSTVSKILSHLNLFVYNSDMRAKDLINSVNSIQDQLVNIFGETIFINGKLDSTILSKKIFESHDSLKKINSIVHPEVEKDFNLWVKENLNNKYLFKESALLFESGTYLDLDKVILIRAKKKLRISRVLRRDSNRPQSEVEKIISNQISEEDASKLADIIIDNNQEKLLLPEVIRVLKNLSSN